MENPSKQTTNLDVGKIPTDDSKEAKKQRNKKRPIKFEKSPLKLSAVSLTPQSYKKKINLPNFFSKKNQNHKMISVFLPHGGFVWAGNAPPNKCSLRITYTAHSVTITPAGVG
jgi:hypothetical protein